MYTEKGSFGISITHLWTDCWIDFVAWPMISFCSDEPGVTAHICIRSYKTGRSLPHIYIYIKSRGATRQLSLVIVLRKVMERFRRLMKNISLSKKWSSSTQFGCISLGFGDESTCRSNVVWIVSFQNNWIVCMFDPRKSLVKFG